MILPSVSPAGSLNCITTTKSLRASVVPSSVVTTQASADVSLLGGENPSEVVLPGANNTGVRFPLSAPLPVFTILIVTLWLTTPPLRILQI